MHRVKAKIVVLCLFQPLCEFGCVVSSLVSKLHDKIFIPWPNSTRPHSFCKLCTNDKLLIISHGSNLPFPHILKIVLLCLHRSFVGPVGAVHHPNYLALIDYLV